MNKQYKSEVLGAIHDTMQGLHKAGVIDSATMRHFDKSCLTTTEQPTSDQARAKSQQQRIKP